MDWNFVTYDFVRTWIYNISTWTYELKQIEKKHRQLKQLGFRCCVAQLVRRGGNNETAVAQPVPIAKRIGRTGIEKPCLWVFRRYLKSI